VNANELWLAAAANSRTSPIDLSYESSCWLQACAMSLMFIVTAQPECWLFV